MCFALTLVQNHKTYGRQEVKPFFRKDLVLTSAAMWILVTAFTGGAAAPSIWAPQPLARLIEEGLTNNQDIKGMKIGVPKEYYGEGLDERTVALVKEAIRTFVSLGAEVEEISMPYTEYALPAYYIIAPAECSSNLARFDGVRYGYRDMEAEDVFSM